jgi:hypothetical protein
MRVALVMDFIGAYTTNIIGSSVSSKHAQSDGLSRAGCSAVCYTYHVGCSEWLGYRLSKHSKFPSYITSELRAIAQLRVSLFTLLSPVRESIG